MTLSSTPPVAPFRRVGLVGLGLMGGSLARALKALPDPPHIRAMARDGRDLEEGLAAGVLDEAAKGHEDLLSQRDLVVYATPLGATLDLLEKHRGGWEPDTVISDMASLKGPVLGRMITLGEARRYVGSHPMAGGEGKGFGASRPGLFRRARIWVTTEGASAHLPGRMEAFWRSLGGNPERIQARAHDRLMIWVSHLPQLTANALALTLDEEGIGRGALGPGGRDMTRLAGSAPEMWEDLLTWAGPGLPEALECMESALSRLRAALEEGRGDRVAQAMERTRTWSRESP